MSELKELMYPKSVAVVGASPTVGTMGYFTLDNFISLKFKGNVYPVNPRYEQIEGLKCYPNLSSIPETIEVALIVVANKYVKETILQCVEKEVKYVILFSSGFAELGEEGSRIQEEIVSICKENNIRLLGPNSMGIYNVKDNLLLTFAHVTQVTLLPGSVGIASQSGGFGGIINTIASEDEGIGFSYVTLTGNQADLNTGDFLEVMLEDEDTKVVTVYMESVPDGEKFKELSKRALQLHKPLIVFKSGRSEVGKKAALSHTASLTGSDETFRVLAKQNGLTMVGDVEETVDAIKAFNTGRRPKSNKVAILSISGATAIIMTDICEDLGLEVVQFKESTIRKLKEVIPPFGSPVNPIDVTAMLGQKPEMIKDCLEILIETEEVDSIIVSTMGIGKMAEVQVEGIIEQSKQTEKPITVAYTGQDTELREARKELNVAGVPTFNSLLRAAKVIQTLVNYENAYNKMSERSVLELSETAATVEKVRLPAGKVVNEPDVKRLLAQFDLPIPRGGVGRSAEELCSIAKDLQYPLVAKIVSDEITHKSDVGGVILPIKNETALVDAYYKIVDNVAANVASDNIDGILVEELADKPFLEMFIGVKRDPDFGPVMLCGLGGIYVEIMKDISQRLLPISQEDALEMIKELKCYPLFAGARTGIKYDVQALSRALVKISNFVLSMEGSWKELEINPLIIFPEGQGVLALDGLITLE